MLYKQFIDYKQSYPKAIVIHSCLLAMIASNVFYIIHFQVKYIFVCDEVNVKLHTGSTQNNFIKLSIETKTFISKSLRIHLIMLFY